MASEVKTRATVILDRSTRLHGIPENIFKLSTLVTEENS